MMSEHRDRLNDLCNRGELDELLAQVPLDAVAATWCRYTERSLAASADGIPDDDPDWWAINFFLCNAFRRDGDLQRRGLLALLQATVDEGVVGCIGAGPLEDLVSDNEDDLLWLEEQAQENEALRIALRHVWADTYVSDDTMARLDAAAGQPLARVRADYIPSPESLAADEARLALFDATGDDWAAVLVNPRTPEERALVENFHEAETRWMDTLPQRSDEDTGRTP
jgi:hypothetical protein